MKKTNSLLLFVMCSLFCALFFSGCATLPKAGNVLATVDGEPLTVEDLQYSIQIAHRREDLSSAGKLNIQEYLQKLINDRLIIQEGRRTAMENYPDVKKKVDAYILRESVVRLYSEEIEQKVSVREEAIAEYYREKYEKFTMGIIEVSSAQEAAAILEKIRKGEDFRELAKKHSTHVSGKDGGEIGYVRKDMGPFWDEAVNNLKTGEVSDARASGDKYYIIKLIAREDAAYQDMDAHKEEIKGRIRKRMTEERSNEYLKYLRARIAPIVHSELLPSIRFETGPDKGKWMSDERPVAEIKDSVLTVREFVSLLSTDDSRLKESVLNQWIDRKTVDYEALGRHYEINSDLKSEVRRYEDQLIKNTFIASVIVPQIRISDSDSKEYYENHREEFTKPVQYKIQQITLNTMEDAQQVLNSLRDGASFSWLAKEKSIDATAQDGGNAGWTLKADLPEALRNSIDDMKPGDISGALEIDALFRIIRLQEKSAKEYEDLVKVRPSIHMKLFGEKYGKLFSEYTDKLRKDAKIDIYDEAVQAFEKQFRGEIQ